jgi:hypothetical protein
MAALSEGCSSTSPAKQACAAEVEGSAEEVEQGLLAKGRLAATGETK